MVGFRTRLWSNGGNNVGIVVPDEIVHGFGRGKRVPVVVTIDVGVTYRNTISSMGGQFLISYSSEIRAATGRGAGDEVDVTLEIDDAPRTVDVPAALADALAADPDAAAVWTTLSYSKQKAHALSVDGAKADDTRARRVQKVIEALHA